MLQYLSLGGDRGAHDEEARRLLDRARWCRGRAVTAIGIGASSSSSQSKRRETTVCATQRRPRKDLLGRARGCGVQEVVTVTLSTARAMILTLLTLQKISQWPERIASTKRSGLGGSAVATASENEPRVSGQGTSKTIVVSSVASGRSASSLLGSIKAPYTTVTGTDTRLSCGFTLRVYAKDARDEAAVMSDVLARAASAGIGG